MAASSEGPSHNVRPASVLRGYPVGRRLRPAREAGRQSEVKVRVSAAFDQDAVIVGAGIAGLAAARALRAAGRRVLVIEKGRGLGGRMATRRIGSAVCDHGAQFFTVRGRAFGGIVAEAQAGAAVVEWCRGFRRAGSLATDSGGDGHARWRGNRGMTDLPKWLAESLQETDEGGCVIRIGTRVSAVARNGASITVACEGRDGRPESFTAAGCVLTAPVPQSLDLLMAGGVLPPEAAADEPEPVQALRSVAYDPCFALMLVLDRPSRVPPPGALQFDPADGGPIAWLADNRLKGISPVTALTIHADGAFSRKHFDDPPEDVVARLVDHARPWIDGDPATVVVEKSLHRWKFALPTTILPAPLVAVSPAPPIVCCGDAFAGPRVEGAASSGLAAGRWLARILDQAGTAAGNRGNLGGDERQ